MIYRFFVTGTDTDVGKTFAGCALLNHAARQGLSTLGLKPVAAGCKQTSDGLRNDDALKLQAASTIAASYDEINPVRLEAAIAPHIAAEEAGRLDRLQVSQLHAHIDEVLAERRPDFAVVEGAGGWLVPLNSTAAGTETFADLALALGYPVILVVALRLGCINHALLSCAAIESHGLKLAGWIANRPTPEFMTAEAENLATLEKLIKAPLLATLSHVPSEAGYDAAADISGLL